MTTQLTGKEAAASLEERSEFFRNPEHLSLEEREHFDASLVYQVKPSRNDNQTGPDERTLELYEQIRKEYGEGFKQYEGKFNDKELNIIRSLLAGRIRGFWAGRGRRSKEPWNELESFCTYLLDKTDENISPAQPRGTMPENIVLKDGKFTITYVVKSTD